MEKFQNEENDKWAGSEDMSYQHKSKKSKQSKIQISSSSEIYGDPHRKNYQYTSDSSEDNHHSRKIKFKPYEDISGEFKKIKPPTFNGETDIRGNLGSKIGLIRKHAKIISCELEFKNQ